LLNCSRDGKIVDFTNPSEREWISREVAALAAEGEDTSHIWMRLDLSAKDVEEVYGFAEFESAMREHGEDLWEAWSLSRSEDKSRISVHQFLLSKADEHVRELDKIAMDTGTKDETRARILLSFLESTRQLGQDVNPGEQIHLSPATIKLINRGDEIFRKHPRPAKEQVEEPPPELPPKPPPSKPQRRKKTKPRVPRNKPKA
jgi:hypothetical protein